MPKLTAIEGGSSERTAASYSRDRDDIQDLADRWMDEGCLPEGAADNSVDDVVEKTRHAIENR